MKEEQLHSIVTMHRDAVLIPEGPLSSLADAEPDQHVREKMRKEGLSINHALEPRLGVKGGEGVLRHIPEAPPSRGQKAPLPTQLTPVLPTTLTPPNTNKPYPSIPSKPSIPSQWSKLVSPTVAFGRSLSA